MSSHAKRSVPTTQEAMPFYLLVSETGDQTDWEICSVYEIPGHAFRIIEEDAKASEQLFAHYQAGFPILSLTEFRVWHDTIEDEKLRIARSGLSSAERSRLLALIPHSFRKRNT